MADHLNHSDVVRRSSTGHVRRYRRQVACATVASARNGLGFCGAFSATHRQEARTERTVRRSEDARVQQPIVPGSGITRFQQPTPLPDGQMDSSLLTVEPRAGPPYFLAPRMQGSICMCDAVFLIQHGDPVLNCGGP